MAKMTKTTPGTPPPPPPPPPPPEPMIEAPDYDLEAPRSLGEYNEPDLKALQDGAEENEEEAARAAEVEEARKMVARAVGPLNKLLTAIGSSLVSKGEENEMMLNYARALRDLAAVVKEKTEK